MLSFINWPAKRNITNSNRTLQDIENHVDHIPNQYQDKSIITSSHEQSHFLASSIRNQFKGKGGFYLLNNRAAILDNPPTRLSEVAKAIPPDLRGMSYQLYLIDAQKDWNRFSIYLFDELSAYINGAEAGIETVENCWSELLQSYEFLLYTAVLSYISQDDGCRLLQNYQLGRAKDLLNKFKGNRDKIEQYVSKWERDPIYLSYLVNASTGNSEFL